MKNTLEYIDSEIARLDIEESIALSNNKIDQVLAIGAMKTILHAVHNVAHADKMAQDKLDFERRLKS